MLEIMAASLAMISVPSAKNEDANFVLAQLNRSHVRSKSAAVDTELWVGPSGQILDCHAAAYAGAKEVGDQVCQALKKRRLSAPRGPSDRPVYAITHLITVWAPARGTSERLLRELADKPEFDQAPPSNAGIKPAQQDVLLTLAISSDGRVTECQLANSETPTDWCDRVENEQFLVMRDEQDRPVEYVRHYRLKRSPNVDVNTFSRDE